MTAEEALKGHIDLCSLRYTTLDKRLDKIEKVLMGAAGLLIIQLCAMVTIFTLTIHSTPTT